MEAIEEINDSNQNSFDAYKKEETKTVETQSMTEKGGKAIKKTTAKAKRNTQTGPKKTIAKKTVKKETVKKTGVTKRKASENDDGEQPKKKSTKSVSTRIKERKEKWKNTDMNKIFPGAPINRTFQAEIARLNEGSEVNNIISKSARERVVAMTSQNFLGLVNRIITLMDYHGIKTMNEKTVQLAILFADDKFDWSKVNDETRTQIHNIFHKKIETVE